MKPSRRTAKKAYKITKMRDNNRSTIAFYTSSESTAFSVKVHHSTDWYTFCEFLDSAALSIEGANS